MRTYEKTHPWITFRIDLRQASPSLWLSLGEAASKCEHIAGVPLRKSTADYLHRLYLAKGIQGTTAIEGNTLSEEEVLRHLEGKLDLPPSKAYLRQEIDNILRACNGITERLARGERQPISVAEIKRFNALVLSKLPLETEVTPGEIRHHSVGVLRYRGAPAKDCQFLLERLCEWLNGKDFQPKSKKARDVLVYAIVKAILAHLYLAWIHPFGDGNGRTARLLEFQILMSASIPSPAAHLLSNHYNLTRQEYYRQLDRATQSGGDILPFLEYALEGFADGLRSQLSLIRAQQWDVAWRNYVHELFQDKAKPADIRQRHLALDLGANGGTVAVAKLNELTPRLARAYATKSPKTLQRDLVELERKGLIERTTEGIRAKRETILAFLPLSGKVTPNREQAG